MTDEFIDDFAAWLNACIDHGATIKGPEKGWALAQKGVVWLTGKTWFYVNPNGIGIIEVDVAYPYFHFLSEISIVKTTNVIEFDVTRAFRNFKELRYVIKRLNRACPRLQFYTDSRYNELRAVWHERQKKAWDEVLPRDIVQWAYDELRCRQKGLLCCDNERVARLDNTSQKRRYWAQKSRGCCGAYDGVATGPDGKRYLIGFNYGH